MYFSRVISSVVSILLLQNMLEQSLGENDFSYYLCFNVSKRFNNLNPKPNRYTIKQLETFQLIKKLNDSGMGYRKISKYLNE